MPRRPKKIRIGHGISLDGEGMPPYLKGWQAIADYMGWSVSKTRSYKKSMSECGAILLDTERNARGQPVPVIKAWVRILDIWIMEFSREQNRRKEERRKQRRLAREMNKPKNG